MNIVISTASWTWNDSSLYDFIKEFPILSWEEFFKTNEQELRKISDFLSSQSYKIYPDIEHVFRCFIPLEKIRLVILGMDPYHDGSAVGYCFSSSSKKIPPSLQNIYKEIENSGYKVRKDGNIKKWASQGCFMLNAALTVKESCPGSHSVLWNKFTSNVISHIDSYSNKIVWLLMGNNAIQIASNVKGKEFQTSHPSPLGAFKASKSAEAFLGSKVFQKINLYLRDIGEQEIDFS